MDVRSGASA